MPLILGTNSIKDTGYNVANSLRLDDGSSAYMHKTPGSAGNRRTFTLSIWFKISAVDTGTRFLFSAQSDGNNYSILRMENHQLQWLVANSGSVVGNLLTNQLLRDPIAWMNVIIAVDTTDGTSGNRQKMYINGTQVTSFATETQPNQNTDFTMNNTVEHDIGSFGAGSYFDGYLAEVVSIDGSQLSPTSFGEFNSDSPTIWQPIDVSGLTFGTNGFHLDFEDSSNLGNDANGGTDFTEVNLAATDQSTDTCTNNFATLNPISPNDYTFSKGNTYIVSGSSASTAIGTFATSSGKWYWEVKLVSGQSNYPRIGIYKMNSDNHIYTTYLGNASGGTGKWWGSGTSQTGIIADGNSSTTNFFSYGNGDILMFAMDNDNGKIWFGENGTWYTNDNSTTTTASAISSGSATPAFSTVTSGELWTPAVFGNNGADNWSINFGNPSFSISSGNADDEGFGNFEFPPPSGFFSLCSSNLAEYG